MNKRAFICTWLMAAFVAFGFSTTVQAGRKYTKAQMEQAIAQARIKAAENALKKNANYQKKLQKKRNLLKQLEVGSCKTKIVGLKKEKRTICVKLRNGKRAIYVNGKFKPVLSALSNAAKGVVDELTKGFNNLGQSVKKLEKDIASLAKKTKDDALKHFNKAIANIKKAASAASKKIANSAEWKKKIAGKIGGELVANVPKMWSMLKGKLKDRIYLALRQQKKVNALRNSMRAYKIGHATLKRYGKAALLSVGLAVGFEALTVTYNCWKKKGDAKKACLKTELTRACGDLAFSIVVALVSTAIDVQVIEPLSHTFASAVSGSIAAATAGVGAASYPIVYVISSISLNVAVYAALDVAIRKHYTNHVYSKIKPQVETFVGSMLNGFRKEDLVCHEACK